MGGGGGGGGVHVCVCTCVCVGVCMCECLCMCDERRREGTIKIGYITGCITVCGTVTDGGEGMDLYMYSSCVEMSNNR